MITRVRADAALAARTALLLAALLAHVTGFHVYWAFGGTWGLSEALGRSVEHSSAAFNWPRPRSSSSSSPPSWSFSDASESGVPGFRSPAFAGAFGG